MKQCCRWHVLGFDGSADCVATRTGQNVLQRKRGENVITSLPTNTCNHRTQVVVFIIIIMLPHSFSFYLCVCTIHGCILLPEESLVNPGHLFGVNLNVLHA